MSDVVRDKIILITGGGGSFGTAFTKYALSKGVKKVICYSRDEEKQRKLLADVQDGRLECFIGDVRDLPRLTMACEAGVDILVHAAAMKQVPACERDPFEAVKTNVLGTMNVVAAARATGVARVVALSTDKAPMASTTYGKTKALAEALVVGGNNYAGQRNVRFACTRYGNVVNSTGSVLPLFVQQRDAGRLTITDLRATRFWMTMDHAIRTVTWTLEHMTGGEIVVPKVPSARVVDMALAIGPGCQIDVIGLRPTEKMHEVLIGDDEVDRTYDCTDVYVVAPAESRWPFKLPLGATLVPVDFTYGSDTDPRSVKALPCL